MIDSAPNTTPILDKVPSPTWQRWFRSVSDWIRRAQTSKAWSPVISGATGTATAQGAYIRLGSVVYFSLSITPSGAWSATAGVTSVSLPIAADFPGGTVVAQGGSVLGVAEASGETLSFPAISTSSPFLISGTYIGGGE